jgi:(S)-ureidoglycine aminohydrolase
MQRLGQTRSALRADHLLLTPDTFVRAPLAGMKGATAIVHAGPAMGAGFTAYTTEFEPGGSLGPAYTQRFIYILEGTLAMDGKTLPAHGYIYLPAGSCLSISASVPSRAIVLEKAYIPQEDCQPPALFEGHQDDVTPRPLLGDTSVEVRELLPPDPAFDFAVNIMTFAPGASLPMVESHIMEHGLLMLAGGGIYRLGDSWYPVTAGDFIWMAPYCPQWFGAISKTPASYIIYKDWNRHPLAAL